MGRDGAAPEVRHFSPRRIFQSAAKSSTAFNGRGARRQERESDAKNGALSRPNTKLRGRTTDGETFDKLLLIKRASELRATYQIRLLTYRAVQEGRKLVIEVSKECKVHSGLRELTKQYPKNVTVARA